MCSCPRFAAYFGRLVGEELEWHWDSENLSAINVTEAIGTGHQVFDWHIDSQPLTVRLRITVASVEFCRKCDYKL